MSALSLMKRLAPLLLVAFTACESERTIPTRNRPHGEIVACVGITGKGKQAGIDYDWSPRNAFWGIVGVESILPPLMVLHHEVFCPIADTSAVKVAP